MRMFFLSIVISLSACGQNAPNSSNLAQRRIDMISNALSEGQVKKIEILQIPARVLTRASVSQEMLESQYFNKVTIRDVANTAYKQHLIDSFKSLQVRQHNEMADLRWAVIFYSPQEQRLGAVYFNPSGRAGAVDGMTVSFQGDFFHWLDGTFSTCLQ